MLGINSFKTLYSNSFKTNNALTAPKVSFEGLKLSPLAHDTISFTGGLPLKGDVKSLNNDEVCDEVRHNANVAARNFKKTINGALSPLLYSKTQNYDGVVKEIKIRTKTAESLKEKIQSELDYVCAHGIKTSFSPYDPKDIKDKFGDIIGARVVLKRTSKSDTSKVIDALIDEVKKGNLKITKIQNYVIDERYDELEYFSKDDLIRLQKAANSMLKEGEPEVELIQSSKDTGYTALHIDIDLSDENYPIKKNGYKAELQILGAGVEKLKEAEQYCYKLKLGKSIKGGNPIYKPYQDYFNKYLQNTEDYPFAQENFLKYTHRAFVLQRKRETAPFSGAHDAQLPTIEQCNLKGELPPELDFNKLAKIKALCDELYYETKNIYK